MPESDSSTPTLQVSYENAAEREELCAILSAPIVAGVFVIGQLPTAANGRMQEYLDAHNAIHLVYEPPNDGSDKFPNISDTSTAGIYICWIRGPMLGEWREQLEAAGAQYLERVGRDNPYTLRIEQDRAAEVAGLQFVMGLREYGLSDKDIGGLA